MNTKNKALAGLIGHGIQGSLSPMIHETEAKENGLELIYRIVDFAAPERDASFLQNMLLAAESLDFSGVNITHPYKEDAFKLVDVLSEDAKKIGSINTIIFKNGKRFGDNTDWFGFSENFKSGISNAEIDIVAQIGTGGAGLAVAYAMLKMGTNEIHLFDTQKDKANTLAKNLQSMFPDRKIIVSDDVENALQNAKGIINATPIGMEGIPGT
ncbi:MAG: shikimate dehydrogenase, partial [Pseudopedobacter saltans]